MKITKVIHEEDEDLKIVKILEDEAIVLVNGAVPGPNGGLVTILKNNR